MQTPEEFAREVFDEHVHWGQQAWDEPGVADLIRARDAEVRAEALAQVDTFAILLAATREGLARSGSKAKGVEHVSEMLAEHAGAIYAANEAAHDRVQRGRPHWNRPWEPVEP